MAISFAATALHKADPHAMSDTPALTYRPVFHFTPAAHWMNDPNGLVFHEGVYHLFFQYHPHSSVWGPMHWGHATSRDLVHWQEQPVALAPDEHGMIFSGSAVLDLNNTSGLGPAGTTPLVALFTHNSTTLESQGQPHQRQSLAYSLDAGKTWHKHSGNPVLPSPGLKDFRDPKVFWHETTARWIMSLACGDHIAFYSSPDLKDWTWESGFGHQSGAHGGVWECPDLIQLSLNGRARWVLLVSLTPGGPQGGSATQYFVGDFDGHTFAPEHTDVRWLDWGADNYAGVTWSNTPGRCIFVGWMSSWLYAKDVPTTPWRGAMTLPRELSLQNVEGQAWLCSPVAHEVEAAFKSEPMLVEASTVRGAAVQCWNEVDCTKPVKIRLRSAAAESWTVTVSNARGDRWQLAYDAQARTYCVDRSSSGVVDFHPEFAARHVAPRISQSDVCEVCVYMDAASMETIADGGLSSLTSVVFSRVPWCQVQTDGEVQITLYGPQSR